MNVMFESKGDFNNLNSWLKDISKRDPSMALNQIANEGERRLASNTPKDTGETAAGWTSEVSTKGSISEISWSNKAHPGLRVNIAKLIDQGYGTGTGGYVLPRPYIQKSMDSVWKDAGNKIAKELIK